MKTRQTVGWKGRSSDSWSDKLMNGQMVRPKDRQMDTRNDRWMDGKVDGWTDRQRDKLADRLRWSNQRKIETGSGGLTDRRGWTDRETNLSINQSNQPIKINGTISFLHPQNIVLDTKIIILCALAQTL